MTSITIQVAQLQALKSKVTDELLTDSGRHFVDGHFCDLTQCHHGDTGEFRNKADGKAIALLWNLWKAGVFDAYPLPPSSETEPGWKWIAGALQERLKTLSTREIGKLTGTSAATVSRLARGAEPTIDHYFQIVRWLGMKPGNFGIEDSRLAFVRAQAEECPGSDDPEERCPLHPKDCTCWQVDNDHPMRETLPPSQQLAGVEAEIARVVQSVNEWDDRTSPDDYPEHLLITSEELSDILRNFAATLGGTTDG